MNPRFDSHTGWQYAPLASIIIRAALVMLLGTAQLSCGNDTSSVLTETAEPSATATRAVMQTSPMASSTATSPASTITPIPTYTATPWAPTEDVPLTPTSTTLPTEVPSPQRTQYGLSARLDHVGHHVAVSQTVTYVNDSVETLPDLLFVVEPNRQPGVFHLNDVSWVGDQAVKGYTLEGARLWVPLPEALQPGAYIGLHLSYELDLPAQSGPFGYTSRQTNLGDWYPYLPPYRAGQGWLVHEPALIGEHLVYDVADYQVEIELASPVADLAVAASGLFDSDAGRYRYRLDAARSFAWSLSSEYIVFTETVESATVMSYVYPEHVVAGEAALRTTADALALYSELFGPYPHTALVVVEADFPDGMEYDGLYFLGSEYYAAYAGHSQGYLTAIAAHETAHQWWYGLVGNDQAVEPWLDEALATYSELLFYEKLYPALVDWWWGFRVTRFNPSGWVNSTIFEHSGFRPYVNAVYLRGAQFVEDLRGLVGDEVLLAILQDYTRRSSHRQATREDFFSTVAEHSTADLDTLVATYFNPVE